MIQNLQNAFLELLDAGLDEDSCLDLYLNTIDDEPIPLDLTDLEKRLGDEFIKAFNLCLQSGMSSDEVIDKCFDALAARSVTGTLVIDWLDESSSRRIWAERKRGHMDSIVIPTDSRVNKPQDCRRNRPIDSRASHPDENMEQREQEGIRQIQMELAMLKNVRWEIANACRHAYQTGQLTQTLYDQLNHDWQTIRHRQDELEAVLEAV